MEISTDRGKTLLALARGAIAEALGETAPPYEDGPWLDEPGATFVTLRRRGELRGCIGSLAPARKLRDDVRANARAAAFADPRFAPLTLGEYADLCVEVTVLSELQEVRVDGEPRLLALLRPNVDGVAIEHGRHRATFLPQVWEQLPEPADFLAHLKLKAGLPADFWARDVKVSRYTVTKWCESDADDDEERS